MTLTVSLSVKCDSTTWGEVVGVMGSFSDWKESKLVTLSTSSANFPTWSGTLELTNDYANSDIEYKYVISKDDAIERWETQSTVNRVLHVAAGAASDDQFGDIHTETATETDKTTTSILGTDSWTVLRAGHAAGAIVYVDALSDASKHIDTSGTNENGHRALVVVCDTVDGSDVSVPSQVTAVVCGLPDLKKTDAAVMKMSNNGVPIVCAKTDAVFKKLLVTLKTRAKVSDASRVSLSASARDGTTLEVITGTAAEPTNKDKLLSKLQWSSWESWGGPCAGDGPTVVSLNNSEVDAFVISADGSKIQCRRWSDGTLHKWQDLGTGGHGNVQSSPAVAANRDGTFDVLSRNADGALWFRHMDDKNKWDDWISLGPATSHAVPGAARWYNRGLFMFAIDANDGYMYKLERRHNDFWHKPSSWVKFSADDDQKWEAVPSDAPGAAHTECRVTAADIGGSELTVDVYAFAFEKKTDILHCSRFTVASPDDKLKNWSNVWTSLALRGDAANPPSVCARSNGFDVVMRTMDGAVAFNEYDLGDGGFGGWIKLGFKTAYRPAVVSTDSGKAVVIAVDDADGSIWVCKRESSSSPFGVWSRVPGCTCRASPAAVVRDGGKVADILVLDTEKTLKRVTCHL